MKTLKEILTSRFSEYKVNEKLVINKTTGKNIHKINSEDLPKYDHNLSWRMDKLRYSKGAGTLTSHTSKMEAYYEKGSKPERLVKSIKDESKLFNRWFVAVKMEWAEAIQEFGKALEERGIFTLPELHAYILYLYNNQHNPDGPYRKYLDLYHIQY